MSIRKMIPCIAAFRATSISAAMPRTTEYCARMCLSVPTRAWPSDGHDAVHPRLPRLRRRLRSGGEGRRPAQRENDQVLRELLDLARACATPCAAECERHDHEHCRLCAQMCRECAEDCRNASASIAKDRRAFPVFPSLTTSLRSCRASA